MQEAKRAVKHMKQNRSRHLPVVRLGVRAEAALHRLEVPIGELVPHEPARRFGVLVQTEPGVAFIITPCTAVGCIECFRRLQRTERAIAFGDGGIEALQDPSIRYGETTRINLTQCAHRRVAEIG